MASNEKHTMTTEQKHIVKEEHSSDSRSIADPESGGSAFKAPYVRTDAEKKLFRKINFLFLPFVVWILIVQFADKAALSVSAVLGIYEDTGLTGSQFSWLGSLFFLGTLAALLPNNILIQKFPIGKYLGLSITLWGLVMLATALCHNFSQLAAVRFLLGIFEAACMPCIYMIVNTLYRRSEQTIMYGTVTMCHGLGSITGSLVGFGVSKMGHRNGIMMWRWNHIIFGALTTFIGIMTFFFMIDNPKSKFLRLTEEEKLIVEERTNDNAVVRVRKIKPYQIKEALLEVRFWCINLAALGLNMQNGALQVFSAQIIQQIGKFTPSESILLKAPAGFASLFFVFVVTLISRVTHQICLSGILITCVSLVGCILLASFEGGSGKMVGFYLSWALTAGYSMLIVIIGNNVSGYTKKIFYNGSLVIFYTLGSFIGPLIMLDREKPRYTGAMTGFCIGNGVAIACFATMYILMKRENRKRLANPPSEPTDVNLDLTDKEDKNFIYRV